MFVQGTPNWMAPEVMTADPTDSVRILADVQRQQQALADERSQQERNSVRSASSSKSTRLSSATKRFLSFRASNAPRQRAVDDAELAANAATSYSQAADVYSLTMVVWELLTGGLPFEALGRNDILELVAVFDARPPVPADVSASVRWL
jgi:serine/threonine protein kinase